MVVNDNEIYFAKIKEGAKIPTKKDEDAGYDMYACFDEDFFVFEPHQTRPVPTGIASALSKKYYVQIEERSSTGKLGLKKNGGVIDSGYRGEYIVLVFNSNTKPLIITKVPVEKIPETFIADGRTFNKSDVIFYPYEKAICELVVHIVPSLETKVVSYDEIQKISSERGASGFGSSGK